MTAGRAETYLRLRAEAELRRALTLPRVDPPDEDGMPGPLRAAVEMARPGAVLVANAARPAFLLARRAAGVLQPLGVEAARALQQLSDATTRRLQPLAEETARRAQPIAAGAARRLQPLAEQAARTVQPLGWRAVGALQTLGAETAEAVLSLRRQAARASGFLPGDRSGIATRRERSADEGVQRLRTVAAGRIAGRGGGTARAVGLARGVRVIACDAAAGPARRVSSRPPGRAGRRRRDGHGSGHRGSGPAATQGCHRRGSH